MITCPDVYVKVSDLIELKTILMTEDRVNISTSDPDNIQYTERVSRGNLAARTISV